jgi:prephenate dehydrogenase
MAGSEKGSVEFARADLFNGAICLITPTADTDRRAARVVKNFWTALGGRVLTTTPRDHDLAMSEISHLPHALATVLVNSVSSADILRLAATGFQDTTRIASGTTELWRDIFLSNRQCTVQAIDRFIKQLRDFRSALANNDEEALVKALAAAKKRRDKWISSKYIRREVQG